MEMLKEKKISVIVPIYNTEKFLTKSIDSILAQTYKNIEIVAVNDHSPGKAEKMIMKYIQAQAADKNYIEDGSFKFIQLNVNKLGRAYTCYIEVSKNGIHPNLYFDIYRHIINIISCKEYENDLEHYKKENIKEDELWDRIEIREDERCFTCKNERSNITYVSNKKNMGLLHARLMGFLNSTGDYIASLDSDDYIGIDYYRRLLHEAFATNADIVVSKFVRQNASDNSKFYRTYGNYAIENLELVDNEILDFLFDTKLEISHLWFVWNKVYKRELWEKCYQEFSGFDSHQIMLEDMMYGIVFMSLAHKYVSVDEDSYFYVAHPDASTGKNGGYKKVKKNLDDVIRAFDFIEAYLNKIGAYEKYKEGYLAGKEKWQRTWYQIISRTDMLLEEKVMLENDLQKFLPNKSLCMPKPEDIFFYQMHTPWNEKLEVLKNKLVSDSIKYVSFDIFDTLVVRPFYKPTDLFEFLNVEYNQMTHQKRLFDFSEIRINAEKIARNNLKNSTSQFEDITIDEIYDIIHKEYNVSIDICNHLKEKEKSLEIQFCESRKKIKEIYDLAVYLNKRIICISDMYLDSKTIWEILRKNGYKNTDHLFLSSDLRLTKDSGKIYEYVLRELDVDPEAVIHIGDNFNSDYTSAKKCGINAFHIKKTSELFLKNIDNEAFGEFGKLLQRNSQGNFIRYVHANEFFGIRCMLAKVANRFFDNPFISFEQKTDFNRNPSYIGYFALGMHAFGISKWLVDEGIQNKKDIIHFAARDGYVVKQVYDRLRKFYNNAPESNYFYMSRKSFLPLAVKDEDDLLCIKKFVNIKNKSPREILQYIEPIIRTTESFIEKEYKANGILLDSPFNNEDEFRAFINVAKRLSFDGNKNESYRRKMGAYLNSIFGENDAIYDIGYSGRAQAILSAAINKNIDAYYVHLNNDSALRYSDKFGFSVSTFYDYTPALTGKIRELLQSDLIPSCIGYDINTDEVKPIFEESSFNYHQRFVMGKIQNGAIEFTNDFLDTFGEYLSIMNIRNTDISFAHEYFILKAKPSDMQMFSVFHFEDDLFENKNYRAKNLVDIWTGDLVWQNLRENETRQNNKILSSVVASEQDYSHLINLSHFNRMKYLYKHDRREFKRRIFIKSGSNRAIYKAILFPYDMLRNIKYKLGKTDYLGDFKQKFRFNPEGNIVYTATSEYGLLCCILNKLLYYPNDKAILVLSVWRKHRYEQVIQTGIFDKVLLFNDLELRKVSYGMDSRLKTGSFLDYEFAEWDFLHQYGTKIPFNFNETKKIIIAGNAMPLGCYLESKNIKYEVIEDGAGIYTNPALLLHFIEQTFPRVEQYMINKYNIFINSKNITKTYINPDSQVKEYDRSKTVEFKPVELMKKLSQEQREQIFDMFGIEEAEEENSVKACLLLNYLLSQREKLSVDEEISVYAQLADIFASDCDEIHLKPHPDSRVDFSGLKKFRIIPPKVLSELLWYETKTQYQLAVAAVTTSINNITCTNTKVFFDEKFINNYNSLILYYEAASFITSKMGLSTKVVGCGINNQILSNILLYSNISKLVDNKVYRIDELKAEQEEVCYVVGNPEAEQEVLNKKKDKDSIVMLYKKESLASKIFEITKTPLDFEQYHTDLNTEYFSIETYKKIDDYSSENVFEVTNVKVITQLLDSII